MTQPSLQSPIGAFAQPPRHDLGGGLVLVAGALLASCGGGHTALNAREQPTQPTTERAAAEREVAEREELAGLTMIESPSNNPIVTLRVSFAAGSADDREGQEGASYLAAHLMAEGGTEELTYPELTSRLYPMAAEIGAFVDRDQTVFVARVHRDHLDELYPLFLDVLRRPRFDPDDFKRVLEQTKSALTLSLRGNDDEELGKETLQGMLYEGHPYAHPTLGTESSLGSMTLPMLRVHAARVFCGPRATVGVAGQYPKGFSARIASDLERLNTETCEGRPKLPVVPRLPARVRIVEKGEASSVAISAGAHTDVTRDHPDYPALLLASAYLGQHRTFAGRLMTEIRGERGLNYGDYAYAEHFVQDGWSRFPLPNTSRRDQYFSIWIRPVKPEHAHFALRLAVKELRDLRDHGLSQADFDRVRDFVSRYFALYLQTESRRLGFEIDDAYYGLDRPWLESVQRGLQKLTPSDVQRAVREHVDLDTLQIAMVASDAEALRDALASEEPSPIEYASEPKPEVEAEDEAIIGVKIGIPRARIEIVPVSDMFK